MTNFRSGLKKKKPLVLLMLCAFLAMTWSPSCSGSKKADSAKGSESKEDSASLLADAQGSTQEAEEAEPCNCPPSSDESAAEVASETGPFSQEEWDRSMEQLKQTFSALEEADKAVSRETFDPQAIVDKVGNDPDALFQWVRDNVRLASYRGILRGPVGVLMDRTGNSLDRALLLHELLRLAGFEARLAQADLSRDQAKGLADKHTALRQRPGAAQEAALTDIDGYIRDHPEGLGMEPDALRKYARQVSQEREKISAELAGRVAEQTGQIQAAIKNIAPRNAGDDPDARAEALRDHWWVQCEKEGTWQDYDSARAGSEPGQTIVQAKKTCQPDEIAKEQVHSVAVKVLIEQWKGGSLKEKPVLHHVLNASESFGQRIMLRHIQMNWPEDYNYGGHEDPAIRLKSAVLEEKEWQPVLTVGTDTVAQSSFTSSGDVNKNPEKEPGRSGAGGLAGGLFGALGGGGEEKEEKKGSTGDAFLTAEWVEFTIHRPGHADTAVRRAVFDLLGPAAREASKGSKPDIDESGRLKRGLALLGETNVLVQVCQLSPEFLGHLMAKSMLENQAILEEILQPVASVDELATRVPKLSEITPLPGPAFLVAAARLNWSDVQGDLYFDQPNIIRFVRGLSVDRQGKIAVRSGLDIVSNELAFHPGLEKDAFRSRLYQGVLDTNTEALAMRSTGRNVDNVAELYILSKKQKTEWVALSDPSDRALRELGAGEDTVARVRQDLRAGYIVIAPKKEIETERGPAFGWWRLARDSGTTLGLGSEGGQAMTEYAVKIAHWVSFLTCAWELVEAVHDGKAVSAICLGVTCALEYYAGHGVEWGLKNFAWNVFQLAALNNAAATGLSKLCTQIEE
jgi:hypothetical protein